MTEATANLDIRQIMDLAVAFGKKLKALKAQLNPPNFNWYPFDSFGVFPILDTLLTGKNRTLLDLAGGGPIVDIGCADGDLSFFFESLGYKVHAIDYPPTNHNHMYGIAALRTSLKSSVEVRVMNLDEQFKLPDENYGLALFLGILYHLKNPFYALETLSRRARYALLSTRVAQFTPDRRFSMAKEPVAYLLGADENDNDWSNYWIFSDAGLKRLLVRAGWEICDNRTVGCTIGSDPAAPERDERAFCLLRSRRTDQGRMVRLLRGWHSAEGPWRWTEKEFSVLIKASGNLEASVLELRFTLPDVVTAKLGPVTLSGAINGVKLPGELYAEPGEQLYVQQIPRDALRSDTANIEFFLDKAMPPNEVDRRELGILVSFINEQNDVLDSNLPLKLL
jgi:tRNA (mo5U34)-methyltransferase